MRENSHKNFFEFIKKYLEKINLRFSLHYVAYPALFLFVVFSVVSYVTATTPNPGHPWSELGDGVFAVTNNQTVARTYTFPDADATVLTSNSAVTVTQGGTGLSSIPDKSLLVTTADNTLSALAVGAGQSIRRNASDTAFEAYTPVSTSGFVATDQSTPQTIGSTGDRLLKLWATDITVTNAIAGSVTGNAGTVTNGVYTNAANVFSQVNPLTTPAESWIGPSSTAGIYFKGGNVGIGTTSPGALFTIQQKVDNGTTDSGFRLNNFENSSYFSSFFGSAASGGNVKFQTNKSLVFEPTQDIYLRSGGTAVYINDDNNRNVLIAGGGKVGIGEMVPTATLHLKAGSDGAGLAPLKLTAGTNLSSPEAGAIEFDGSHFYGTVGSTRHQLDQQAGGAVVKVKAANEVLTNSIVPQDDDELYFSIGANEDWAFRFVVLGYASGTPDFRFAVSAPTGATCYVAAIGAEEHQATPTVGCGVSTEIVQASSAVDVFEITGSIKNGSTAGTATLQWAQGAKFVSDITVYAGSTLYAFKTFGADIAEVYYTDEEGLDPGTLVSLEGSDLGSAVKKSGGVYDRDLIGVVTTSPGLVLSNSNSRIEGMKDVWVALSGRAPVKVNTNNGPIQAGDFLTSSDVPGVAMKATKSGPIIGQAMTPYDGEGEGQIIAFLKNGYSNGVGTQEILGIDLSTLSEEEVGKYLLSDFMEKKEQLGSSVNISEIFTDRLMAGLEIISPKILTNELGVAKISSSNDNGEIKFVLNEGGALVIANDNTGSEEELVRFDSAGNVNFEGKITAKEIEAESVKGIDSITNRITLLSEGQEAMTLTASAVSILSDTMQVLGIEIEDIKNELGNLNQQFVSMSEDNVLFDNRVKSLEDILLSETLSGFSSISVLDLETTGSSKFSGLTSFEGDVSFLNKISLEGQLEFKIPPLFNKDTAGFAIIREEGEEVRISFDQEYMTPPIVSVNITFDKKAEAFDRVSFFGSDFKFVVIDKDETGFTIILNKKATQDIQFSWIALAVEDPNIFESIIEGVIIEESGSETTPPVDDQDQVDVEDLPEILIIEEATSEELVPEEEVGDISI